MPRSLAPLTLAVLAAIALGACGDTDESSTATTDAGDGGAQLEVVAEDIAFGDDSYEATAGTVDVRYVNDGAIPHTLLIEDVDGFKLAVDGSGDEDTGTVELEAGTYTLYCDIPGHREAGMEATLDVG